MISQNNISADQNFSRNKTSINPYLSIVINHVNVSDTIGELRTMWILYVSPVIMK